jgi:hypothetical protein
MRAGYWWEIQKRQLGTQGLTWMEHGEIGEGGMDWVGLAQDRDNSQGLLRTR